MKKCLILAAAALVAFAACTKVETVEAPAQKVSFEVAKYMQSKAETSLLSEADANGSSINKFQTNAWYHSVNDGNQYFMKNVEINWKSAKNEWSSDIDYYWPKTGYVNFYSYAGTPAPTSYGTTAATEGTITYTNAVINYNDNVLVADAAYGFHANAAQYHIDHADVKGVTTLFRHYLAKVAFNVSLRTTEEKKSATNYFKVEVLEASVKVSNKGTLTLTNADPNTSRTAAAPGTTALNPWTNANTANANVAWVPAAWNETSGSETVETIQIVASPVEGKDMKALTLNLAKNAVIQTETDTVMLAMRSVMPQALTSNQVFYIKYKVSAYNDASTDPYSVETLEFTNPLTSFIGTSALTAWNKNTKYTYNVFIDPIASKITFDPAVEEWVNEEQNFNPWLN
ncbi:MAG: hypothetical protein IJU63_00820 [Bacteroidales bacterium]|nr:hypothetical protein [Bacteroidales bacterium]